MNLRFDQPFMLLLALTAIPLIVLSWRALSNLDLLRRVTALALRTILLAALAVSLASPRLVREHDHLTVVALLDVSGSVKHFADLPVIEDMEAQSSIQFFRQWFRQATQNRSPEDRFGLIVFDGEAAAISVPTKNEYLDEHLDVVAIEGTNIAEAIEFGLAMLPADTAKRLVLVSDGNETTGAALNAAEQAAGGTGIRDQSRRTDRDQSATIGAGHAGVPIDVLPVAYHVTNDVQVVRLEAPPTAQPQHIVTVRMLLEATQPIEGRLTLLLEGATIDLNGAERGTSRRVMLPAGRSVHLAQVKLGDTPVNRLRVAFEALVSEDDLFGQNNTAEAFIATPGRGLVLVLDRVAELGDNDIEQLLGDSERIRTLTPADAPHELLEWQNYDLVILNNVAAYDLTPQQHEMLTRYVHDLGGGLIMIGGEHSFGPGAWNGTKLEDILPLELDPPRELILPSAALVLVLDKSGSMNRSVAGARASQQQVANEAAAMAIESMRAESLVGVITFDMFAHEVVPLQPNTDPKRIADQVRGIVADGGTNMIPALRKAHRWLADVEAEKKRIVCLSDGQSHDTNFEALAQRMAADNIKVTTIAVGDDADQELMKKLADLTDGEFLAVINANTLPRVLVDAVQVVNQPLIKEGLFTPLVQPTGSLLTLGMNEAPPLEGLVITSPKPDPNVQIELTHPDGEPVLAHWQAGLGRVAAFTSDARGQWSRQWRDWSGAATFWSRLARTIARPAARRDAELITSIENDRLMIAVEFSGDELLEEYLVVEGTMWDPAGRAVAIRLRQTAPGRYVTSVPASRAGNYIVALTPRAGTRRLSPIVGGISRTSSKEYRTYQSNIALLEEIAKLTGGRTLDIDDPKAIDLFDRAGMTPTVSLLPAWRTFLWAALALLLLDIACRRLAWNYDMLRGLVLRAIARVTPAHVRGSEVAATLSSLRRVSAEVEQRRVADSQGLDKLQGEGRIQDPTSVSSTPPKPIRPESAGISRALNTLLGRRKSDDQEEILPTEPATSADDEPREMSSETASNLLAAKRRAREQMRGNEAE